MSELDIHAGAREAKDVWIGTRSEAAAHVRRCIKR